MTDAQLCERFDNDILYDAHGLNARIERSHARQELLKRGKTGLKSVIDHIEAHRRVVYDEDLRSAWIVVLNQFETRLDPARSAPQSRLDVAGWIAWAKKIAET